MLPGDPRDGAEHLAAIIAAQQEIATARLDPDAVMGLIVERVRSLTGAAGAMIDLADGAEMVGRAAAGSVAGRVGLRVDAEGSLSGLCFRTGAALRCDDTEADDRVDRAACRAAGVRSLVVVPLVHGGEVLGVLKVGDPAPGAFGDRDVRTLQLMSGLLAARMAHAAAFEAKRALLAERTAALVALHQGEQRFRGAFDGSAVGMALVGTDGRFLRVNRALCELLGRAERELLDGTLDGINHPEDRAAVAGYGARVLAGELDGYEAIGRVLHAHGHAVWAHLYASLVRDPEGRPGHLVVQLIDVTARRSAEAERAARIREQAARAEAEAGERRHRSLAEAIPQIVWTAGPGGEADFYNGRWAEYTGLPAAPAPPPIAGWGPVLHPDDLRPARDRWAAALGAGEAFDLECRLRRAADGAPRWHLVRGVPVRDAAGRVVKWFGTCTDIADRKAAEAELRAAKETAEAANHAKDRFLAVLSHELRTPLTPVLATVTAMLDEPETAAEIRPTLEMIRRSIELEARLIDDLLDVTRIVRGQLRMDRVAVDVHGLIHQTLGISRSDLHGKRMALELDLAAARHHVRGDPARLQQVLWNLMKNAVKFTPEGGRIRVRTRNVEGPGGAPRLVVEVADSGIGIEAEALPRIFHAFEQGEVSTNRQYGGLGLGLAIARFVAEAHDGRLTAASPGAGLGSTFTLDLAAVAAPARAGRRADRPAEAAPPARALRILLVEDDQPSLRVLARLLQQRGCEVTTAISVASALEAGARGDFDLLVSDIGLPDGTGLDLMRQLREVRPVRGIALSGFGLDADLQRSLDAGFLAHLTKPVNFASLEATIRQVAGGVEAAGPA